MKKATTVTHKPTRAFLAMCDAMGIGCYYVHSNRTQHVWNIVQVDGEWYHMDVQGDDLSNYNFWFLVSDDIMRIDGYSWDFDVYFEGGEKLLSGGRHVSPDGNGLHRISKLLNDAARESRG